MPEKAEMMRTDFQTGPKKCRHWRLECAGRVANLLLAVDEKNGGAIALGHPLGMRGVRLVTAAMRRLHRHGGRYAHRRRARHRRD